MGVELLVAFRVFYKRTGEERRYLQLPVSLELLRLGFILFIYFIQRTAFTTRTGPLGAPKVSERGSLTSALQLVMGC